MHWTPSTIESLYCDDLDHKGLVFWYNLVVEMATEREKNLKK